MQVLVWGPVIALTAILIANTLPYYWAGLDYGMLPEKTEMRESPLYLTLFYLHVGPSILLLTLPLFQFLFRVTKRTAKWHMRFTPETHRARPAIARTHIDFGLV